MELSRRLERQPFFVLLCACALSSCTRVHHRKGGQGGVRGNTERIKNYGEIGKSCREKEEGRRWRKRQLMVFVLRGLRSISRNKPSTTQGTEQSSRLLHSAMGRATKLAAQCQQPLTSNLLVEGCGSTDDDRCSGVENGHCKLYVNVDSKFLCNRCPQNRPGVCNDLGKSQRASPPQLSAPRAGYLR